MKKFYLLLMAGLLMGSEFFSVHGAEDNAAVEAVAEIATEAAAEAKRLLLKSIQGTPPG